MIQPIDQHYSVPDVAAKLGVSPATIWRLIRSGRDSHGRDGISPVYKLSHKNTRVPASAVNRYLKSRIL